MPAENATPLSARTLVPWCGTSATAEPGRWYEARIHLGSDMPSAPPEVSWANASAQLTWADGVKDLLDPASLLP
jgi:hypothetical protein